jgi:hypothetical protein
MEIKLPPPVPSEFLPLALSLPLSSTTSLAVVVAAALLFSPSSPLTSSAHNGQFYRPHKCACMRLSCLGVAGFAEDMGLACYQVADSFVGRWFQLEGSGHARERAGSRFMVCTHLLWAVEIVAHARLLDRNPCGVDYMGT